MSRTVAVNKMNYLFLIMSLVGLVISCFGSERHTLIIANEDTYTHIHILELLSTGEIVTTGQLFDLVSRAGKELGLVPTSGSFGQRHTEELDSF